MSLRVRLGVNIDHVATLRQARGGYSPNPVEAAKICERVGVDAVVMHLREDRRHIQDEDVFRVSRTLSIKLNLEMALAPSVVRVARRLAPQQVTLVPEKRAERTTEGGLDVFSSAASLERFIASFRRKGTEVSLFIDPDPRVVRQSANLGAQAVEFHTGYYCNQISASGKMREWKRLSAAVQASKEQGLRTYAGHGIDYINVRETLKINGIEELNIGYSIVTRALLIGFENAVREMRGLLKK